MNGLYLAEEQLKESMENIFFNLLLMELCERQRGKTNQVDPDRND